MRCSWNQCLQEQEQSAGTGNGTFNQEHLCRCRNRLTFAFSSLILLEIGLNRLSLGLNRDSPEIDNRLLPNRDVSLARNSDISLDKGLKRFSSGNSDWLTSLNRVFSLEIGLSWLWISVWFLVKLSGLKWFSALDRFSPSLWPLLSRVSGLNSCSALMLVMSLTFFRFFGFLFLKEDWKGKLCKTKDLLLGEFVF